MSDPNLAVSYGAPALHSAPRWVRWLTEGVAALLTVVVAAAAFAISFHALSDLARLSSVIPAPLCPLLPVVVDVFMLQATVCLVAASARHDAAARRYHARMLVAFALLSVAGNAWHALALGSAGMLTGPGAAVIAIIAPLALLASTHGLIVHLWAGHQRRGDAGPTAVHDATDPQPAERAPHAPPATSPVLELDAPSTSVLDLARAVCARGRVTKTEPEVAHALHLAHNGIPASEIADRTGVHRTTISRWLDLAQAITAEQTLRHQSADTARTAAPGVAAQLA